MMDRVYYDKLLGKLRDQTGQSGDEAVASLNGLAGAIQLLGPDGAPLAVSGQSIPDIATKEYVDSHTGAVQWSDITGKPTSFPPSAHTHAIADVTGLEARLATFATTAMLITPASVVQYESIQVGPTRGIKNLAEAYAYLRTKNMGSKGFELILDPGNYDGVYFERGTLKITSADAGNPAVIGPSTLTFINCVASLENLNLTGRVTGRNLSMISLKNVNITANVSAVVAEQSTLITLDDCIVTMSGATVSGVNGLYMINRGQMLVNNTVVKGFDSGVWCVDGSFARLSGGRVENCNIGFNAVNSSMIIAYAGSVAASGNAVDTSPASGVIGNYNSIVRR